MKIKEIGVNFKPTKGSVLIGEPFMADLNFRKSLVLICEHEEEGSIGFVLNKPMNLMCSELVPEILDHDFPLFYGGPIEENSLHFIHRLGNLIQESIEISNGIFWGGSIEQVNLLFEKGLAKESDFKFFIGYSGWGPDQLETEIEQKAWWTIPANQTIVFDSESDEMWEKQVKELGEDFAYLANSPEDYLWN
jgi:putative transcriptional regulator